MPLGVGFTGSLKGVQLDSPPSHDIKASEGWARRGPAPVVGPVAAPVVSHPANSSSSQWGPLGPLVSSRPRPCPRSPSGRQKGAPRSQVGHAGAWGWVREPPAQKQGARFLLVGGWVSSPVREPLQTVARRREWYPIPVFLPRESCGQRSLVGCCP